MSGQQRAMQIERSKPRNRQQFGLQNLAISRHDKDIRIQGTKSVQHFRAVDPLRLKYRDILGNRHLLDGINVLMMTTT